MTKKEIAIKFLKEASCGDVRAAYDRFIHPEFIHHNAYFKGDRETLMKGMEDNSREMPNKKYEVLRALEDGDLVTIHGKVRLQADLVYSVIHIFRFEGELIIEEWEASQQLLADSPNEHGIF